MFNKESKNICYILNAILNKFSKYIFFNCQKLSVKKLK